MKIHEILYTEDGEILILTDSSVIVITPATA